MKHNKLIYPNITKANKSSEVAELGNRLATIDTGRNVGGCCAPCREGGAGSHLTQCAWARHTSVCQVAS